MPLKWDVARDITYRNSIQKMQRRPIKIGVHRLLGTRVKQLSYVSGMPGHSATLCSSLQSAWETLCHPKSVCGRGCFCFSALRYAHQPYVFVQQQQQQQQQQQLYFAMAATAAHNCMRKSSICSICIVKPGGSRVLRLSCTHLVLKWFYIQFYNFCTFAWKKYRRHVPRTASMTCR